MQELETTFGYPRKKKVIQGPDCSPGRVTDARCALHSEIDKSILLAEESITCMA